MRVFGVDIPADVEQTREAYTSPHERCDCAYCRNFSHWSETNYSPDLISGLESLGVDPKSPTEIIEYGRFGGGPGRHYEVIWSFYGTSAEPVRGLNLDSALIAETEVWVCLEPNVGPPDPRFDPATRLTIVAKFKSVPWVLDEAEPVD